MEQFYIHDGNNQQGPFTVEELKTKGVTKETQVWYEGLETWKKANEINELAGLFKVIPPPLTEPTPPPIILKKNTPEKVVEPPTISNQRNKKNSLIALAVVVSIVLLGVLGAFVYMNQQTKQTEITRQIQEQNLKLQEQNSKIQEQESIETARKAEAERQAKIANAEQRAAELASLQAQYDNAVTTLRRAQLQLEETQKFKLLRTPDEKQQQVQSDLEVIRSWENEVDRLKREIDKY